MLLNYSRIRELTLWCQCCEQSFCHKQATNKQHLSRPSLWSWKNALFNSETKLWKSLWQVKIQADSDADPVPVNSVQSIIKKWKEWGITNKPRIQFRLQTGEHKTNGEAWRRQHHDVVFFICRHRRSFYIIKGTMNSQKYCVTFRKSSLPKDSTWNDVGCFNKITTLNPRHGKRPSGSTGTVSLF